MYRALVILAHPGRTSFNSAWAQASRDAFEATRLRDLHSEGFDPVERPSHYRAGDVFDPLKAQEQGPLPNEVAQHLDDLHWADLVVVHFPLWWFGPPAILKGWCDRVLAHGHAHTVDERFDTGRFREKRVVFCVTTGASEIEGGPGGKEGDTRLLLWPLAMTFRYCGFEVCQPLLVHGVHGYWTGAERAGLEARLAHALETQSERLSALVPWHFNRDEEFDANGRLSEGADVLWPFIDPNLAPRGAR